jgi:hypothetical protein
MIYYHLRTQFLIIFIHVIIFTFNFSFFFKKKKKKSNISYVTTLSQVINCVMRWQNFVTSLSCKFAFEKSSIRSTYLPLFKSFFSFFFFFNPNRNTFWSFFSSYFCLFFIIIILIKNLLVHLCINYIVF